ncbi:MAG: TetR/AcrR family transcriptional regulator [Polyangiaceae bacterium]
MTTRVAQAMAEPRQKEGYHHGDLRRALLDATLLLVREKGPHGFTLRAAARAAGVTPAAAYHHFEDKDALLAGVAEEGFELFREALKGASVKPTRSASERSRNVAVAYVLFAVEHPTLFRVMVGFGVRLRRGQLGALAIGTYKLVRSVLIEGLQEGRARRVSDAEVLGWWSVVHGLAFLAIDGHLQRAGRSAKGVDQVVRAVIDALDARSA